MPTVLVHGIDTSVTSLGAPTFAQINDALSSVQLFDLGGWVGPRPRVTRQINTGSATASWVVHFAWPYSWPDNAGADTARTTQQLLAAVRRQLAPTSADWTITVEPYTPAVNGELSWWQTGAASVTQTGDEFPTGGGRLDATENPIGPTTAATHPGTLAGAAAGALDRGTNFLKAILPLLLLAVGVYAAEKAGAFVRRRPKRKAPDWSQLGRPTPAGAERNPGRAIVLPFLLPQANPFMGSEIVRLSPSETAHWRSDAAFRRRLGGQLARAAKKFQRPVMVMDARADYLTTFQPNPRPAEWGQYAPSTPYPCHPYEASVMGLVVPGRGGGTVSSCATPAEPMGARRRRGQVQIGLPGVGTVMPKSRARARVRRAGLEVLKSPIEDVAQAAAAYSGSRCPLPYAPGLEFPHTVSRCDPGHKVWKGYEAALEDARERASIVASDATGPEEWDCLVLEELAKDSRFPQWEAAASTCTRGFQSRQRERRGKSQYSAQRERGQARAQAIAEGVDVTGAEYRDAMELRRNKGRR